MFDGTDSILVIGAHPDDEVLGPGGTIAKHAAAGDKINILIITEGTTQQYDDKNLINKKKEEAKACAEVLGAASIRFGELPDMQLKNERHTKINEIIEHSCKEIEPDIVYTHSRREVNRDHIEVHDSTLVATRPGSGVTMVLAYETPSSTEYTPSTDGFSPSLFVDIRDYLDKKIEAFQKYETEIREFPHPRSPEALRARAKSHGTASGAAAAEAFDIIRAYR
jgi:LmbE family N-acetylglucosaminyl deacetylase